MTDLRDDEMIEAFEKAAGERNEISLEDGRKVERFEFRDTVSVDGKPTSLLLPDERNALLAELRRAGAEAHLDPARNPFIKLT